MLYSVNTNNHLVIKGKITQNNQCVLKKAGGYTPFCALPSNPDFFLVKFFIDRGAERAADKRRLRYKCTVNAL